MNSIQAILPKTALKYLKKSALHWVSPMLASTLPHSRLDHHWIFEHKLDGYRALILNRAGKVQIMSRNQIDLSQQFPEIVSAIQQLSLPNFILDGELVVLHKQVSSFKALQERLSLGPTALALKKFPVFFYAFDLIYFNGYYCDALAWTHRKALLTALFPLTPPLFHLQSYAYQEKAKLFKQVARFGWEGLIAKDKSSPYQHRRSRSWIKIRWHQKQEFVIGGFTAPQGQRAGFGALLIGYYADGRLQYAGKVGTGYTEALLHKLHQQLLSLKVSHSPFAVPIREPRVSWVKPRLIAEVKFTEWTSEGRLRHPSFEGLRLDKSPKSIVRESPGGKRYEP